MIHEMEDDAVGLPVRRCDRCGAVLVVLSRCPSHRVEDLQARLEEARDAHAPLTDRILEALRCLGPTSISRLCDLVICASGEAATALVRLERRGLAHRHQPGVWAPGLYPNSHEGFRS